MLAVTDAKLLVLPALAALALAATTGCQGGPDEGRPSLSARPSLTASPTVSLPSATRSLTASPSASRSGIDRTSTDGPTAEPTTEEPTSQQPTTAEATTAEPTTAQPTTEAATTTQPTSSESTVAGSTPAAQETASDGDATSPWLLLVALAAITAALVGVIVAVRRRSARRDWTASLDGARAESGELARDLAPSLLAGTRESRRGGWEVARPRVVALEDRLAALARSAREEADSTVATELATTVGDLRRALDEEVRAPDDQVTAALRVAQDATRRLEERLTVLASSSSERT